MDFGLRKKTVPRKRPPLRKKIRSRALRELNDSNTNLVQSAGWSGTAGTATCTGTFSCSRLTSGEAGDKKKGSVFGLGGEAQRGSRRLRGQSGVERHDALKRPMHASRGPFKSFVGSPQRTYVRRTTKADDVRGALISSDVSSSRVAVAQLSESRTDMPVRSCVAAQDGNSIFDYDDAPAVAVAGIAAATTVAIFCTVHDLVSRVELEHAVITSSEAVAATGASTKQTDVDTLVVSNAALRIQMFELREKLAKTEISHASEIADAAAELEEARCTVTMLEDELTARTAKAEAAAKAADTVRSALQTQTKTHVEMLERRLNSACMALEDMATQMQALRAAHVAASHDLASLKEAHAESENSRKTLTVALDAAHASAEHMTQNLRAAQRQVAAYEERERRHMAEDQAHEQALTEAIKSAAQTSTVANARLREMEISLVVSKKEAGELRGRNGVLHASISSLQATVDDLRVNLRRTAANAAAEAEVRAERFAEQARQETRQQASVLASEVAESHAETVRKMRVVAEEREKGLREVNAALAEKLERLVVFFEARQQVEKGRKEEDESQCNMKLKQEKQVEEWRRNYADPTAALQLAQHLLEIERREKLQVQRKLESLVLWFEKLQAGADPSSTCDPN